MHNINAVPKRMWEFSASSTTPTVSSLRKQDAPKVVTPSVYYSQKVWAVMWHIIHKCPKEVGWMGYVTKIGHDYLVEEIFLPEQIVSAAETDISPDAMATLTLELIKRDMDPEKMIYWGHSHVNMGVSPSGQDETQIDLMLQNAPVFIRAIHNKRGEGKVDVFDTTQGVVFQAVHHDVHIPALTDEQVVYLDELIKSNVKDRVYVAPAYQKGGHGMGYQLPFQNKKDKKKHSEMKTSDLTGLVLVGQERWIINDRQRYYDMAGNVIYNATFIAEYELDPNPDNIVIPAEDLYEKGKGYPGLDSRHYPTLFAMFEANRYYFARLKKACATKA